MGASDNSRKLRAIFIEKISATYPALSTEKISPYVSEQLLSPFVIELPSHILDQAQEFVAAVFENRKRPEYVSQFRQEFARLDLNVPGNYSMLMSYDFHVDPMKQLKLIEVNTNASFLALGDFMYQAQGLSQPFRDFTLNEISKDVMDELSLNGHPNLVQPRVAIIDEEPEKQKLYLEFLVFAEMFRAKAWKTEICDFRNVPEGTDFIYNRHTDFLFEKDSAKKLKSQFNSRAVTFSPNPVEYLLLADKTRMVEWSEFKSLGAAEKYLPKAELLSPANAEAVWAQKKKLFFKPRQSFGSKQTYRGEKLSRKLFDEILGQDFIVQEFVPAPEVSFETDTGPQDFKYDLRFYAYQNRVQSVIARIYQGQVTNLKTPLGGFAAVKFH